MMQKSVKSLQNVLNETITKLGRDSTVTNSAYTQARANLNYTAFIELNQKAIVDVAYEDESKIKTYKGMRVLGIDGSKIMLPNTQSVIDEFGQISYTSKDSTIAGAHAYGLASVMYDVLNNIVIDSKLAEAKAYEVDLAIKHLKFSKNNDLVLCDRNYPSYRFLSHMYKMNRKSVIRCSAASFKEAREMLKGNGEDSQIVTLKPHHSRLKEIQEYELPLEIKVRFVRVKLSTDEYEVLVTNLLDEEEFLTEDFLEIYHLRWGVESFYDIIKNRLNLENFTGKSALAVLQDFYSTIYITGLETILTYDTNVELDKKPTKNPQKVNHATSFNAIKNAALDLLYSKGSLNDIIRRLEILFRTNPTQVRVNRDSKRRKPSNRKSLNYLKRKHKICY